MRLFVKRIILCITVPFFVFLFSGCFLLPKEEAVLAPPIKEPAQIAYSTIEVKKANIVLEINCLGYFVSTDQKDLSFKNRSGYLKAVHVKAGDKVKKGDLLAELETDNLRNEIGQQEIIVSAAESALEQLKSTGQMDVEGAKLQLEDLQRKYNKVKSAADKLGDKLTIKDVFPDVDMEDLESQIKKQELALRKAEEGAAQTQANSRRDLELARLKLENLHSDLDKARLVSPVTGIVDYVNPLKEGDPVGAYQTMVRIADPTKLQLQYSDDKASDFRLGQKVTVEVQGKDYEGEVVMDSSNVPEDADEKLRSSIRISVKGLPEGIAIGDSANINLVLQKKENTIVLPKSLVLNFNGRKFVKVLEDGIRKERDVELGIQSDTQVEIIKGLEVGDKVIER